MARQRSELLKRPLIPVERASERPAHRHAAPEFERRLPIRRSLLIITALSLFGWVLAIGAISLFL